MGKRVRLKRGDMFRFVLDEARYGLGQIIDPGMVFYMSVLREPVGADCDLAQVDLRDILLCGRSTDALFVHDRWHVVGNLPVPDEMIPRPCVKVESGECNGLPISIAGFSARRQRLSGRILTITAAGHPLPIRTRSRPTTGWVR